MARLLTAGQAADKLDVTTERLRQFREEGRITAVALGPRGTAPYLYDPAEITRFLRIQRPKGRPKSKAGKD